MKWLIYTVVFSAVFDVYALDKAISNGADIMFPGMYIFLLVPVVLYTLLTVILIEWRGWVRKRPFLAYLLASPIYVFVFFHFYVLLPLVCLRVLLICLAALFGHRKSLEKIKSAYRSVIHFFSPPPRNRAWKKDWK